MQHQRTSEAAAAELGQRDDVLDLGSFALGVELAVGDEASPVCGCEEAGRKRLGDQASML
jgi:hypothetical protein